VEPACACYYEAEIEKSEFTKRQSTFFPLARAFDVLRERDGGGRRGGVGENWMGGQETNDAAGGGGGVGWSKRNGGGGRGEALQAVAVVLNVSAKR
jgi:hypothetical protein